MEIFDKTTAILVAITGLIGTAATYFSNNITAILTILGVIVGSTMTYKVHSKIQQRTWERERTIRNIETIYNLLYDESIRIENVLDRIDNMWYQDPIPTEEWNKIENSHLHFMIDDKKLKKELGDFYVLNNLFNKSREGIWRLALEVLEKRGKEVYKVDIRNIFYTYDGNDQNAPSILNCILCRKHPKDVMFDDTGEIIIRIEYRVENTNTIQYISYNSTEDLQKFDNFWKTIMADVANNKKLQNIDAQKLKIRNMNVDVREKLVKKIEQREKL